MGSMDRFPRGCSIRPRGAHPPCPSAPALQRTELLATSAVGVPAWALRGRRADLERVGILPVVYAGAARAIVRDAHLHRPFAAATLSILGVERDHVDAPVAGPAPFDPNL